MAQEKRIWARFSTRELMWPPGSDPISDLKRVFQDTLYVNYRVVDTDLLLQYIGRYLERLPSSPMILDAGGGWGRVAIPMATEGYEVVVVDKSRSYIAEGASIAEQLGVSERIRFTDCDLREYEGPENSADLILYIESVEYLQPLEEKKDVTRRLFRLLKPGGLMIMTAVDKLAMANFMLRRFLFWPQMPDMYESGAFADLRGTIFYPPTHAEFDEIIHSLGGEVVDRRTYLHTDSILMSVGGLVTSIYHDNPDLPRRLYDLNLKLMDDPGHSQRGFFHVACVRRI